MKKIINSLHKKYILIFALCVFSTSGLFSQGTLMPLGPHNNTYNGNVRGYYFTAPVSFTICGLALPSETGTGLQNIEVVRFTAGPPPAYSATTNNFTSLFYVNNAPNGIIPVNISVNAGDIIGIYGARGTGGTLANSYGGAAVASNILGNPVTLYRSGMQASLNTQQMANIWNEDAGSISRVEMYYNCCPPTAPTISCPANINVNNDAGNCSAVVNYTTPTNPCASTITQTAGLPSGSAFPVGTTTNTFQATNAFGTTTCSFTVTVVDNENPTITCPGAVTINTDAGQCTSTASIGTATGTDNCGVPTITNDAPASFPIGNTTVTWTSTDGAGNFVTCTQVVTVVDNENPTITCPGAVTINTDAGQCTSTASIGTATGTDNCGVPTITNDAPASFPIGNTTVTWTSTDGAGNFVTCTQVVTVVDNENPTITCPGAVTINTDAGQCTSTASIGTATGTDNCGVPTITNDAPASFPIGNTTVTWTSTDGAGNFVTCTQVVTVVDNENPTITCPGAVTINTDAGQCTSTASIGTATGTDNCGVPTITNDAPASFPIGNTTVTWTSTDGAGNFVTCTQVVTVVDNENPTITCPGAVTINTDAGQCTSTASIGTATGTDNCGVPTITNDAPASFPIGNTTVTWTSTDGAGNFVTCTQVVTVVDNENPTITCPGAVTINTDAGQCTSTASIGTATGTDNCGVPTITNDAPASFPIGNTTVTWTSTDGAGNFVTCTQVVTVVDNENPTITCPGAVTINTDAGQCTSTASIGTATGTDNCGVPTITNDAPASFPIGNTTVTWTSTDGAGNFVTCTQVVTVVDNENPTITCPGAVTINTDAGQCTSTASIGTATGTDNCGVPTITNDAPASFPIGNTTVTWTSTDGAGNFVTCTQLVTVVDNENPTITCPTDTILGNTPGLCGTVVNYTTPVGTDNCTGVTTVLVSGLASGATFPVGTTTVVYAVVDGSNNSDTCSFNVTVADSLAPTAVCQDITIYLDNTGNASILATNVDGGSTDDCAIDTLTLSQYNYTCSEIGANNVTLYVTDTYGNVDSCTAVVTVMDTIAPTVICQNINIYVDNAGNASISSVDIDGGSNDACGIASITLSNNNFTCSDLGLNNVTLYVEDNNGNIDSCVAQVTVFDTIAPTITCPSNQEVSTDNTCMYEMEDYTSLATASMDNCDLNNVIITQMPAAGTLVTADNIINDKGQTVVTIIVEDLSGNADTCEFVVDVTCIEALTIPNVFTPNGDGKNDLWNIAGKENYPDMVVKVFNRWGDLMFESDRGYTEPWDGKYNNVEAPSATYYYIIMLGDGEEDLSGTINIVR